MSRFRFDITIGVLERALCRPLRATVELRKPENENWVKKFYKYLAGAEFTWICDCRSALKVLNNFNEVNARIVRWLKGTIPPFSKLFFIPKLYVKDSACSTGHVGHFFPKKLRNLQEINA